jgi:hypothetical protein
MAEAFDAAVEKIDRALELGEIDQEEYWRQYKALMDEYLTEGTEDWEDANYQLLKGQKDTYEELQGILDAAFQNGETSLKDYITDSKRLRDAYFADDKTAWQAAADATSTVVKTTLTERLNPLKPSTTTRWTPYKARSTAWLSASWTSTSSVRSRIKTAIRRSTLSPGRHRERSRQPRRLTGKNRPASGYGCFGLAAG